MCLKYEEVAADPEKIVLEFEDEIPMWIQFRNSKRVVSRQKWLTLRTAADMKWKLRQLRRLAAKNVARNEEKGKGHVDCAQVAQQDILQGNQVSGADRVRVTLVDRHIVRGWFKDGAKPKGEVIKNVLVVPGVHARLSNIT